MANKIRLGRATKARLETIKETLSSYELVYSMDTRELGVKNSDGTITYIGAVTEIEWANVLNKPTFAAVATSGAYADLTGKPNLDLKLDKNFSALPEQANPLLTDVLVLNRGTTAQKVTLGSLLAQVDSEIFQVVSSLPTTGVGNKIYLVPSSNPETQNVLDEFIWVDDDWEKIGAVSVDLSNYFNKTEINSMLEGKVDKNAPITPGTSTKITYDAKGLVTGGGSLVASDIPSLSASKITSGTLSSDRLPSIPFNLLPVGTSSSTVAQGNHSHLVSHLSDVAFTNLSGGQMLIYTPEGGGKWVNFTPNFASRSHTHSADDITSGILSADQLPNIPYSKITTLGGGNDFLMSTPDGSLTFVSTVPFNRLPIGSGSNEVAIGNHKHSVSEITNLQATLNTKLDSNSVIDGGDL